MKKVLFIIAIILVNFSVAQNAADFYTQAQMAMDKKDFKGALRIIEQAIKLDPSQVSYLDLKARSHYELKQYEDAYATYTLAISKFPHKSFLYNNRGNFMLGINQIDLAIRDFNTAMELAENDTVRCNTMVNRGVAKMNKRDFQGAYEDLLIAYTFDSTNLGPLINLGAVCDEIGRGEETLKYLLKAIEVDSLFYPAYGNIGFKYQNMGQYETAIKYFNKVLEFNPNEPLGYSNRSFNKLKLGDIKGAMRDIERSLKLYPDNSYAYKIRALIFIEEGKMKNACEDLQTALDKGYTAMYGDEVVNLIKQHCRY